MAETKDTAHVQSITVKVSCTTTTLTKIIKKAAQKARRRGENI